MPVLGQAVHFRPHLPSNLTAVTSSEIPINTRYKRPYDRDRYASIAFLLFRGYWGKPKILGRTADTGTDSSDTNIIS